MPARTITLHVFASGKGGVGKSTLAIACAKLLSDQGRTCVLLDADFTGTSLADGLLLCAPVVATKQDGALDFYAPSTRQFLSREETIRLRMRRKDATPQEQFLAPPFLNDIFLHGDLKQECRIEALCWRHEDRGDRVLYLPSSPLGKDIGIALGWLFRDQVFTWLQRLTWLLDGMQAPAAKVHDRFYVLGVAVGATLVQIATDPATVTRRKQLTDELSLMIARYLRLRDD